MPTWSFRALLAAIAMLAECLHLGWEALHGGIISHHLFQRSDFPGLSNAWGLLVLPALAIWAGGRSPALSAGPTTARCRRRVGLGFAVPLVLGVALSLSFVFQHPALTETLFFGLMLLALLVPAHRPESLFGFVLGMSWTFGALLPTLIGGVIAGVSWLVRSVVRRARHVVRPA